MRRSQNRIYLTGNVGIIGILKMTRFTLIESFKTFIKFFNLSSAALSNKAKFEANGSLDNSAICDSMEQTATSSSSESNGESTDFGDSNTYNVVPSTEVREESKFEESKRKATLELKISELDKSSADLFSTAASDDHKTDKTDSKEISSVDTSPDVSPQSSVNKRPFPMIRSSSLEHDNGSISFDTGLISVESDDTLYDAISVLKTFGFHRVLVMDYSDNDPLYILTYKRILYFIYVMVSCRGTMGIYYVGLFFDYIEYI